MPARKTTAAPVVAEHETLNAALMAVQAAMPEFQRDKVNPHFGSAYLSLESLMPEVLAVLQANGILLVQYPSFFAGTEGPVGTLVTHLTHVKSGESTQTSMLLESGKSTPQAQGSALTYARRYAITCLMGITVEKDDDANRAMPARTAASAPSSAPSTVSGTDDTGFGGEL